MYTNVRTQSGADWPSGEPGEFPVAWQAIWPATYIFSFFMLLLFPAECTKVIISEFAIQ